MNPVGMEGTTRAFRVGKRGIGRTLDVVKRVRSGSDEWTTLPPVRIERAKRVVRMSLPNGADEMQVEAYLVARAKRRFRSHSFSPRSGARLQGGMALVPLVPSDALVSVEFRIVAHVGGNVEVLHRKVLEVGTDPPAWMDYDFELDRFVGQKLELEFDTRVNGPSGRELLPVAPVWSLPAILEPAPEPGWSFVVVSLDTLRADHVGAYGAPNGSTPVLDALAADGVTFERAMTTYPSTTGSHMSLFTGLYPSAHDVRAPPAMLSAEIPMLAELLAPAGYVTAAVTENAMIVAAAGFERGFDSYTEFRGAEAHKASGHVDRVMDVATSWLSDHRDERFFLFLHTYEVHSPYNPPSEFDRYPSPDDGRPLPRARAQYRGGVAYTDHELGRLRAVLDELGLSRRTVLIVTSDHGEGFGEHGVFGHGHHLTEELLRVPLVVRAPGLAPTGHRVAQPVSWVDLAPTILELAGLEKPPAMHGRSLVALLSREDGIDPVPVYGEVGGGKAKQVAARDGDLKWIFSPESPSPRAYDLEQGEGAGMEIETEEVLARGRVLRARFEEMVGNRAEEESPVSRPGIEIDPELEGQLRALGYLE